jgi:hypothetical protein
VHALVEKATSIGDVTGLIHAAGVSPSQAGSDILMDGGVTATYWYGELAEVRERMIAKPSRS